MSIHDDSVFGEPHNGWLGMNKADLKAYVQKLSDTVIFRDGERQELKRELARLRAGIEALLPEDVVLVKKASL